MKKTIITHVHIFKNAGTSFDWILEKNFGKNFLDHRKPLEMKQGGVKYLYDIYKEDQSLIALSSHHIPFDPKDLEKINDDFNVLPIYFMRDPIDRSLSVYKFEKKQKNVQNEGPKMAKELNFLEYVQWSITDRKARTLRNMNTMFASGIRNVDSQQEIEQAKNNLNNTMFLGVVDRFDESMVIFEEEFKKYFSDIDLSYIPQNVNQKEKKSLNEKKDNIEKLLGKAVFEKFKNKNQNDIELYEYANNLLDERIKCVDDFDDKLEDFKRRCKKLTK